MSADLKEFLADWFSVLLDFLKFFDNEKINEIIAKIEAKLEENA